MKRRDTATEREKMGRKGREGDRIESKKRKIDRERKDREEKER